MVHRRPGWLAGLALVGLFLLVGVWIWQGQESRVDSLTAAVRADLPAPEESDSQLLRPERVEEPSLQDPVPQEESSAPTGAAMPVMDDAPRPAAGAPTSDSGDWSLRYHFVEPDGAPLTLVRLQAAGLGHGAMELRYRANDGTTGPPEQVPELDNFGRLGAGMLRGQGGLPVTLRLVADGIEVANAVVTESDIDVPLRVDVGELLKDVQQVTFRLEAWSFFRIEVRGSRQWRNYIAEEMPQPLRPDGSVQARQGELLVGLRAGSYSYKAFVYDPRTMEDAVSTGEFDVADSDLFVDVDVVVAGPGPGSVEGAIGPQGDTTLVLQLLPSTGHFVDSYDRFVPVADGRYHVTGVPPGEYSLVVMGFDRETMTVSVRHEETVVVHPGEVTRRDLTILAPSLAQREWTLRSKQGQGIALTVEEILGDGSRRMLLDLPSGQAGMRLALPSERRFEVTGMPLVKTAQILAPDPTAAVLGVPNDQDEIWFRFPESSEK